MGNAHNSRPEIQARKLRDMNNPEFRRRRAMWTAARGKKRDEIANWNVAWNVAGRPADFPDFAVWRLQERERQRAAEQWLAEHPEFRATIARHPNPPNTTPSPSKVGSGEGEQL